MNHPFITRHENGTWWLEVEDSNGTAWVLAEFNEKGILLTPSIPNSTGWNLARDGSLKLTNSIFDLVLDTQ